MKKCNTIVTLVVLAMLLNLNGCKSEKMVEPEAVQTVAADTTKAEEFPLPRVDSLGLPKPPILIPR